MGQGMFDGLLFQLICISIFILFLGIGIGFLIKWAL